MPEYIVKNGTTYRVFSDQLGSPRIVADASTGNVIQRLDFHAFGETLQDSNPGWQPFGFAGGLYDEETGLTRFGSRDLDPVSGRWLSIDPMRLAGGQTNLYAYVDGEPINRVDPSGMDWVNNVVNFTTAVADAASLGFGASRT